MRHLIKTKAKIIKAKLNNEEPIAIIAFHTDTPKTSLDQHLDMYRNFNPDAEYFFVDGYIVEDMR